MTLSTKNAMTLLLDINQNIEEYAEATVENIIGNKQFDVLIYPPNSDFTALEQAELNKLGNNEHLKSALKKTLADNCAGIIFELLNLLDGTSSPKLGYDDWTGVKLVDEETNNDPDIFYDMLHDSFFEQYWEWKKIKEDKNRRLDNE